MSKMCIVALLILSCSAVPNSKAKPQKDMKWSIPGNALAALLFAGSPARLAQTRRQHSASMQVDTAVFPELDHSLAETWLRGTRAQDGIPGKTAKLDVPYTRQPFDRAPVDVKAVEALLQERDTMRKSGDFDDADDIRWRLQEEFGVMLQDKERIWYVATWEDAYDVDEMKWDIGMDEEEEFEQEEEDDDEEVLPVGVGRIKEGDFVVGRVTGFQFDGTVEVDIRTKTSALLPEYAVNLNRDLDEGESLKDFFEVGQVVSAWVVGQTDGHFILSRRTMIQEDMNPQIEEYVRENKPFECTIIGVGAAGAQVVIEELGGLAAFLPKYQWLPVDQEVEEEMIGTTVRCKVLDWSEDDLRVSAKAITQEEALDKIKLNTLVEGVVTGCMPYGVFLDDVRTLGSDDEGAKGFMHVSDISKQRVLNPADVLPEGTRIKAVAIKKPPGKGVAVATKPLEKNQGDLIRDPQMVWDSADEMLGVYMVELSKQREEAKKAVLAMQAMFEDMGLDTEPLKNLGAESE